MVPLSFVEEKYEHWQESPPKRERAREKEEKYVYKNLTPNYFFGQSFVVNVMQ
jgi:hypothetical protein